MFMFWYTMGFVTTVLAILNWIGILAMPWVVVTAPLWGPVLLALAANLLLSGIALVLVAAGGSDEGRR